MPPYEYAPIQSPFVGSIADTMQRPAQALAAAEIAKGNAWAQAAQGTGQAVSGAIQQATDPRRQLEQQQVDENKRMLAYRTTATKIAQSLVGPNGEQPTPEIASAAMTRMGVPIQNQQDILKSLESGANHQKEAFADVGHIAYQAMKGLPPTASDEDRAHAASAALGAAEAAGFITREQTTQVTGMLGRGANPMGMALGVMGQSPSKRFDNIIQDETKPLIVPGAPRPGATPSTVMVGGRPIATGAQPGPAPMTPEQVAQDAATLGTPQETPTAANSARTVELTHPKPVTSNEWKDVLLDGKPAKVFVDPKTKTVTTLDGKTVDNAVTRIKPVPPASTVVNPQALSDVKETVAGMIDGSVPPILPGRATKEYLATLAEAHRQGYDLQAAVTDWNATQKHIATLNGAQQLRLNQSINQLPELLDSVDALAAKWKGGRFPLLNKANLALAKGGAYGSDVASVANQLDAQIADVTADLGNVYMGGNSPTDHALSLASKSLSGDWDQKVLHDMVTLARKNVVIRHNSIKNTGVQGASPDNPYAPKTDEPVTPPAAKNPFRK